MAHTSHIFASKNTPLCKNPILTKKSSSAIISPQYCGIDCSSDFEKWCIAKLEIDHIITKAFGGADADENLVVACLTCNHYKRKKQFISLEQAREEMRRYKNEIALKWYRKFVSKG